MQEPMTAPFLQSCIGVRVLPSATLQHISPNCLALSYLQHGQPRCKLQHPQHGLPTATNSGCSRDEEGTNLYLVHADGSLAPVDSLPASANTAQWQPCCVVDVTVPLHPVAIAQREERQQQQQQQQQHHQQQQHQQGEQTQGEHQQGDASHQHAATQHGTSSNTASPLFLVGPWSNVKVAPSVWGFGFDMGCCSIRFGQPRSVCYSRSAVAWWAGCQVWGCAHGCGGTQQGKQLQTQHCPNWRAAKSGHMTICNQAAVGLPLTISQMLRRWRRTMQPGWIPRRHDSFPAKGWPTGQHSQPYSSSNNHHR